ncbi:MAG: DHHA1 domain-containing protein, partial [Pseudomonadota bacterium]
KDQSGEGEVLALLAGSEPVDALREGQEGALVLDRTPFYGESGGQVGDRGYLRKSGVEVEVLDTTKSGGHFIHHVHVAKGEITRGDRLEAEVDSALRQKTTLNHSATHLLHAALREVLGTHVAQRGSLVDERRLRFDFSHGSPMSAEELERVESRVNEEIRANTAVSTELMAMDKAIDSGAMALFGEKYGDVVRVVTMGQDRFSVELCGGTHVANTGEIGFLKLGAEAGLASGVRRIEAVTGAEAVAAVRDTNRTLAQVCESVRGTPDNVGSKVEGLRQQAKELERELARLKQKLASAAGQDITSQAVDVGGVPVLAAKVDGADSGSLRGLCDQCKDKLGTAVILLAAVDGEKITLIAGVTKDLTDRVKAGDLIREFAGRLGGKGGGRPDMAQGGGSDVAALAATLQAVPGWVGEVLS